MKKRTLTVLTLLFLLSVLSMAAHAQGNIPEVSNLYELQEAISQAVDGDTIIVTDTIIVDTPVTVGDKEKHLYIKPSGTVETVFRIIGGSSGDIIQLHSLSISFAARPTSYAVEVNTSAMVIIDNFSFEQCGGGVRAMRGQTFIQNCEFINCSSVNGGAVYVEGNASCILSSNQFTSNMATYSGGAVYAIGTIEISDCTFSDNAAVNNNGGAVAGNNVSIFRSTITGNHAAHGGGVYTTGNLTANITRIYDNTATVAGADIFCEGTATITADDYLALFGEIITKREADTVAWYIDNEEKRYTIDEPTEVVEPAEGLSNAALTFIIYKAPEPEPEPTPEPDPKPEEKPPVIIYYPRPSESEEEPVTEEENDNMPLLMCSIAEIDRENVVHLIDAAKKFVPAQERITRGRLAALVYGLLSTESQAACDKVAAVNYYIDLVASPYKNAVDALSSAGVFYGNAGALFLPDNTATYGQLLCVLTRFVEPSEGYIGSFNPVRALGGFCGDYSGVIRVDRGRSYKSRSTSDVRCLYQSPAKDIWTVKKRPDDEPRLVFLSNVLTPFHGFPNVLSPVLRLVPFLKCLTVFRVFEILTNRPCEIFA